MVLETERLFISELTKSDAPFFFELVNDADWKRFIGDRNVQSLKDAENYLIERIIPSYKNWGFGFYKVSLKCDDSPIGISGLVDRATLEHVDVGFAFLPKGRGKGYAFESTKAILDYAKEVLNLQTIIAIANRDNKQSHMLLEKLGLQFDSMVLLPDELEEICLFKPKKIA